MNEADLVLLVGRQTIQINALGKALEEALQKLKAIEEAAAPPKPQKAPPAPARGRHAVVEEAPKE